MATVTLFDDALWGVVGQESSAVVSECPTGAIHDDHNRADCPLCDVFRYELRRVWDASKPLCYWIMLNPSTANHRTNDRTIAKCIRYAKRWRFGGIVVLNLYALRATNPRELDHHFDPIGPDNDDFLARIPTDAMVICAWGARGKRGQAVVDALLERGLWLHCLKRTKGGLPSHPLYLRDALTPIPFAPARRRLTERDVMTTTTETATAVRRPAAYPIATVCARATAHLRGDTFARSPEQTDTAVRLDLPSRRHARAARNALTAHGYHVAHTSVRTLVVDGWDVDALTKRAERAENSRAHIDQVADRWLAIALGMTRVLLEDDGTDPAAVKARVTAELARNVTSLPCPPGMHHVVPVSRADRERTTGVVLRLLRRVLIAETQLHLLAAEMRQRAAADIDRFLADRGRYARPVR
jgi:hypothetical protein